MRWQGSKVIPVTCKGMEIYEYKRHVQLITAKGQGSEWIGKAGRDR